MPPGDAGSIKRLCYHGTNVEIRPGDRVRLKRWFRGPLDGVVCYVPGISPNGGNHLVLPSLPVCRGANTGKELEDAMRRRGAICDVRRPTRYWLA